MRLLLAALLAVSFSGCAMLAERAPGYAANALDSTASRSTNVALDTAESGVRNSGSSSRAEEPKKEVKVTRQLDEDDVLVRQGESFVVGKRVGSQVMIVTTGQKIGVDGQEVINVRPASKKDLKAGNDVFFTTGTGDVRRAHWNLGAVTDDGQLGDGLVSVGPESRLDWKGQVAARR